MSDLMFQLTYIVWEANGRHWRMFACLFVNSGVFADPLQRGQRIQALTETFVVSAAFI